MIVAHGETALVHSNVATERFVNLWQAGVATVLTMVLFGSIAEVPGIIWTPPVPTPAVVAALKVCEDFQTPAGAALQRLYEAETCADAVAAMNFAAALPGTRHDYHEIMESALDHFGDAPEWIEWACQVDIQLVQGDPAAAIRDGRGHRRHDAACSPFLRLASLYVDEGFLAEALNIERALQQLPRELQPRYEWTRPSALIAGLDELTG